MQRLDTIPGVDEVTAWMLIAEMGPEMSAFPDAAHAASWAGLCPGHRESGGKQLSGKTRKANQYVRRALCQAAWAASHTKRTFLAAFYRRMCRRKGEQKAILALAHQLVLIAYQILHRKENYRELGADYDDRQQKPKVVRRLVERLQRLGLYVTVGDVSPGSPPPPNTTGCCRIIFVG